jgi:hypothetical protein
MNILGWELPCQRRASSSWFSTRSASPARLPTLPWVGSQRGRGVTRKIADRAPEASRQGVTLRIPTHLAAPSHALVLREGPSPR